MLVWFLIGSFCLVSSLMSRFCWLQGLFFFSKRLHRWLAASSGLILSLVFCLLLQKWHPGRIWRRKVRSSMPRRGFYFQSRCRMMQQLREEIVDFFISLCMAISKVRNSILLPMSSFSYSFNKSAQIVPIDDFSSTIAPTRLFYIRL